MEIATWIFLGLTIGIFLMRYVLKSRGVDILTLIVAILSICMVLYDPAIDSGLMCLMYCIIQIFIIGLTTNTLMFSKSDKSRRF